MLASLVKKILTPEKIEQVRRFKNLQRLSRRAFSDSNIIPRIQVQIGNTAFDITYLSQIPLLQWRKISADFELLPPHRRDQALNSLIECICNEPQFLEIISQRYVTSFITSKELYTALLGAAQYVNGNIKEAFETFSNNLKDHPTVLNYLLAYRAAVLLDDNEATAFDLVRKGISATGDNTVLQLCLASSYYRTFQTSMANEALGKIAPAFLEQIRNYPIANTPAENLKQFDEELKAAIASGLTERPKAPYGKVGDNYDEDHISDYWNRLYFAFNRYNRFQHGWGNLAFSIRDIIQGVIDNDASLTQVIDFGTFCATPLYRLSKENPQIKFLGVDREDATKKFNDLAFQRDNLEFISGYIKDVLPRHQTNNSSLLFHSRTTTLIYPEEVRNIYKTCARNGIKYIALYENFALSRTEMKYFDFNNLPATAIPYGSVMIIHNYPEYLREAGYEVISEKRLNYADLLWAGREPLLGDAHGCMVARLK